MVGVPDDERYRKRWKRSVPRRSGNPLPNNAPFSYHQVGSANAVILPELRAFLCCRTMVEISRSMIPPMNPLSELGQIAMTVRNVERATAFFRDVLQLKLLFSAGPNLAFFAAGSVRLMLTTPQDAGEGGKNSILYFKVTDIVATHAGLVSRGATNERDPQLAAKMPDHELWIGFIRDPDGNLIGLMEERR